MNVHTTITFSLLGSVLLLACCAQLDPTVAAPAPAAMSEAPTAEPNDDCWHYAIGDHELVAVWVSPRLPGQVPGGFRFVNLIYHDPTARQPILLHARPTANDHGDTIALRTGKLSFAVTPADGQTWREVVQPDDLDVRVTVAE